MGVKFGFWVSGVGLSYWDYGSLVGVSAEELRPGSRCRKLGSILGDMVYETSFSSLVFLFGGSCLEAREN